MDKEYPPQRRRVHTPALAGGARGDLREVFSALSATLRLEIIDLVAISAYPLLTLITKKGVYKWQPKRKSASVTLRRIIP